MASSQQQQQPKNRIPSKVSAELRVFADCLSPSDTYIKNGKCMVQNVFSTLQQESNLSISRSYIGGSVGKSTSVIYPDFDCVVFLNGKYPPLKEMVDEFERILREKASLLKIITSSLTKNTITVSLEFENGVEMDLLPATSFAQNSEEQYQAVLQKLKADARLYLGYSSSLAETQLQFMKNQSGATHQLVRLAKYWYKLCTIDNYIYGGSSIIEILCVDAALDLDPQGVKFEMLEAFKLFLKKVCVVKTLKIAFYRDNQKKTFVRVSPHEFALPKYKNHFQADILKRKAFLIEPANPYNDFNPNIKDDSAERLRYSAKKMLDRLGKLESTDSNEMKTLSPDGKDIALVHYDKLFEPFIMVLKGMYPNSAIPKSICVEFYYQNYNSAHVDAEVRTGDFFKNNPKARHVYRTVMNNLLFLIRGKAMRNIKKALSFTDGVTDIEKGKDVESVVNAFIQENFNVKQNVKYSSANKDHQDYDVTLSIPYRRMGNIYAVRFSMKWSV